MGGGPSSAQNAAASSQANLTNKLANVANTSEQFKEKQQNAANPFYSGLMTQGSPVTSQFSPFYQQRMSGGLPYFNNLTDANAGNTAQAFQPAKAQLERQI